MFLLFRGRGRGHVCGHAALFEKQVAERGGLQVGFDRAAQHPFALEFGLKLGDALPQQIARLVERRQKLLRRELKLGRAPRSPFRRALFRGGPQLFCHTPIGFLLLVQLLLLGVRLCCRFRLGVFQQPNRRFVFGCAAKWVVDVVRSSLPCRSRSSLRRACLSERKSSRCFTRSSWLARHCKTSERLERPVIP